MMSSFSAVRLHSVSGIPPTVVTPPGSKSITNRALVCAALAEGRSQLTGALASDDTRVMIDGWRRLGVQVEEVDDGATLNIVGCGGTTAVPGADLFVGNSGTTVRFLTPAVAALARPTGSVFRLDGVARMRERPIGDLVDALRKQGTTVNYDGAEGFPPISLGDGKLNGGETVVGGATSSQFLSGLLMAAPYAETPLVLNVQGELVSKPYVTMTITVMRAFGAEVEIASSSGPYRVDNTARYQDRTYSVEPDASAASYFWAAAAVSGGRVTVKGLDQNSLQGDVGFCDCLDRMGCQVDYGVGEITVQGPESLALTGADLDMGDISDTAQTLACVALFAHGPTRIRNIAHVRHKETDRIGDLARELRKLGAEVTEYEDGMTITPAPLQPASLATYNDHRMAMSFAVIGLRLDGLVAQDPGCTAKTYPQFWRDWAKLCGEQAIEFVD
jgi:3-phosphoshikimate 1-carboxyvinyltransferase